MCVCSLLQVIIMITPILQSNHPLLLSGCFDDVSSLLVYHRAVKQAANYEYRERFARELTQNRSPIAGPVS